MNAVYTDDLEQVHGCADCLELVAQDRTWRTTMITWSLPALPPGDHRPGWGGVAQDSPEALPALWGGRMVTTSKDTDARLTQRLTTAVFAG